MPPLRDEAEALATALDIGAVDVDEVIDWADSQIAAHDAPHFLLYEAAISHGKYPQDVSAKLRQLPDHPDPVIVRSLLIQLIARKLKQDESRAYQLASALFQMASADEIDEPELRKLALWAWDALDLAADRIIVETPDQVIAKMRDTLERVSAVARNTARPGVDHGSPSNNKMHPTAIGLCKKVTTRRGGLT